MTYAEQITNINKILREYFNKKYVLTPVPAKDLMSFFIQAGIFDQDRKNGLPLRNLLRQLDGAKQLHLIPFIIPLRKNKNTNWFFGPTDLQLPEVAKETASQTIKPRKSPTKSRLNSDECYVLDLCDEVLHLSSDRQHKFPFLLGDPNRNGICKKLPVDAWYEQLNLVVEYNERQHSEPVSFFDKRITVSGITRGEQRKKYDKRRVEVLKKHGIYVVVFSYSDFDHDSRKRLMRYRPQDVEIIKSKLNKYTKTK